MFIDCCHNEVSSYTVHHWNFWPSPPFWVANPLCGGTTSIWKSLQFQKQPLYICVWQETSVWELEVNLGLVTQWSRLYFRWTVWLHCAGGSPHPMLTLRCACNIVESSPVMKKLTISNIITSSLRNNVPVYIRMNLSVDSFFSKFMKQYNAEWTNECSIAWKVCVSLSLACHGCIFNEENANLKGGGGWDAYFSLLEGTEHTSITL